MGASVTLVTPAVAVEPGQSVSVEVRIRNTGTVVDEFVLDVLGDAAGWAAVEPGSVSLFPGAEGTAKAVFSPPRASGTPAGHVPFGLRARSREDPAGSAVEEGSVEVGAFQEPYAELVPRTSRGSSSGSHDLAVDNR
ncbi:MAG: COG1470 family protein, partial [Candidatus Limnocylindrales bacterium]